MVKILKSVVFLDRDGVLNRDPGVYTYEVERLEFLPDVVETLTILRNRGYEFVVISNQGGIAKKIYNHSEVLEIHKSMRLFFADFGIKFLEMYYCPHHENYGKCLCRKPGSLLLEKAIARFGIDPTTSYFIGDKDRDIEAGNKLGINGIKIETNDSMLPYLPLIL